MTSVNEFCDHSKGQIKISQIKNPIPVPSAGQYTRVRVISESTVQYVKNDKNDQL